MGTLFWTPYLGVKKRRKREFLKKTIWCRFWRDYKRSNHTVHTGRGTVCALKWSLGSSWTPTATVGKWGGSPKSHNCSSTPSCSSVIHCSGMVVHQKLKILYPMLSAWKLRINHEKGLHLAWLQYFTKEINVQYVLVSNSGQMDISLKFLESEVFFMCRSCPFSTFEFELMLSLVYDLTGSFK